MDKAIYLDHSATTPVHPEVREAMLPYLGEAFGNPSSLHRLGRAARAAIDTAREEVAALIGADADEIIFTSGGTESNNLAILGTRDHDARKNIVLSSIEHDSVRHAAQVRARQLGGEAVVCPVDAQCRIDQQVLRTHLGDTTHLVSVMHVNNETGTVQDIGASGEEARGCGAYFHTDAVQSVGKIPLGVHALPIDFLSFSAHKISGPKGVGALYVRRGLRLNPTLLGGPQERGRRGGTENVAGIVGFGRACGLAPERLAEESRRIAALRDVLEHEIRTRIPGVVRNGDPQHAAPHILNLRFPGHDGETLMLGLDAQGIAVSTGSACTAGSLEPSHVLLSMGIPHAEAQSALRFSLGRDNTGEQMRHVAEILARLKGCA